MEYYIFSTEEEADACLNAINGSGWFPLTGKVVGELAPSANQKTIKWAESCMIMLSGEWAVPRPSKDRLDSVGVPQEQQDAFIAVFGQDVRELSSDDFVAVDN